MKRLFLFIIGSIVTVAVGAALLGAPVGAQLGQGGAQGGVDAARGEGVPTNLTNGDDSLVSKIINVMLYAIGVVSVVMLIIGGFRYVVSGGQKEAVTAAKNTILYAIIGIVVAILAYAAVNFVISTFLPGSSSQPGGRATSTYGTSTR